ncbi:hypothetical protein CR513_48474, partial [Mucuna pruriens]
MDNGSNTPRPITLREDRTIVPMPIVSLHVDVMVPIVHDNDHPLRGKEDITTPPNDMQQPNNIDEREHRPSILDDYVVYLQEHEFDLHDDDDPITFQEAISSPHASDRLNAMHGENSSMSRK